ncbi:MAG: hypothetical protein RL186_1874 [Pseudomonadota bacterium]
MSLARNTLVQAGFTLMSRLLGYARDRAISNMLGAGWIGDAFATAQTFPNLFRRVLAEGAFSQAFVPAYARTKTLHGDAFAQQVASDTMSVLTIAAAGLTILCQFAMPWIMVVMHGGYLDQPQAFQFAIVLTQITMPYLVGMALSSLFSGILNTSGRFALSAAAPTLLNLTILIAILPAHDPQQAALNAAFAITLAGGLQALALYLGCRHLGVRLKVTVPRLTNEVKTMIAIMGPAVLAGSATQINVLVSQSLSSLEVGAKSWLYAADRLFQLPLGLIGVAIGVALLPRLAQAVASENKADSFKAIDEAFVLSMAFALPATAALVVMPFFLMQGLWTGGQFTTLDARATADALLHYGWGVPAFICAGRRCDQCRDRHRLVLCAARKRASGLCRACDRRQPRGMGERLDVGGDFAAQILLATCGLGVAQNGAHCGRDRDHGCVFGLCRHAPGFAGELV